MKQKQSNISLTPVKVLASFVSQKVSSIKRRKKIINKKKKEGGGSYVVTQGHYSQYSILSLWQTLFSWSLQVGCRDHEETKAQRQLAASNLFCSGKEMCQQLRRTSHLGNRNISLSQSMPFPWENMTGITLLPFELKLIPWVFLVNKKKPSWSESPLV